MMVWPLGGFLPEQFERKSLVDMREEWNLLWGEVELLEDKDSTIE